MRSLPDGIELRPATAADLPACERIWRDGLNGYLGPLGFPDVPLENPGLRRLHAHTFATDPTRFWVASRDGVVVAFGSAVLRGTVWFLSMLFVDPKLQARGVGRAILARILPDPVDGVRLSTATDSAQPISNALYASLGMVPRVPLFNLVGRPAPGWTAGPLPAGVLAVPWSADDPELDVERDALDLEIVGFRHPQDHAFVRGDGRGRFAYVDDGALVGYGYASEVGRVGPIAARRPDLLGPILGHLLTAVEPRGASSVWLPGSADGAIVAGLDAGLRIEGFPTLLCWSAAFADFGRYVPISPGLL
jgi:GNAT superfamily N-acetyltransferase